MQILWKMKMTMRDVCLMHGCCLEMMQRIPDASVDMVLTDMPYGTTACKWDSVLSLDKMWEQVLRVAKANAAIVLTAQTPFDKVLGCSNLSMLKYEWIWEKPSATGFFNAKKAPMKAHENILVFYKKLPTYNPQMTHGHERRTASRTGAKSDCYGKTFKRTHYDSTSRYPRDVLRYSSDKQREKYHPTQKPVALMEYLIKTYTNEGETVLDFTMGSGTTGVSAMRTWRNFIGIEINEESFNVAKKRIEDAKAGMVQDKLFA